MSEIFNELNSIIARMAVDRPSLKILEAGCGSVSNVTFDNKAYVVGIDVSLEQLHKNVYLNEKILGDIQIYPLPDAEFDVVICWDVLEHLQEPVLALDNFVKTLKVGGVMILAFPNVASVKGILAKITPLWFHQCFYRIAYGEKFLMPGYEPFPTFLRWVLRPSKIKSFAESKRLSVEYFEIYESGFSQKIRHKMGLDGIVWNMIKCSIGLLSMNVIDAELTDCVIVLRKCHE